MARKAAAVKRCRWATSPLMIEYHDKEWGVPVHDDRLLFEFLILEGAQAGLKFGRPSSTSAKTIGAHSTISTPRGLRDTDAKKVHALMRNPGIVRNRLKISSTISNAKAFLEVQKEFGSFDRYLWQFVEGSRTINRWKSSKQLPASTAESDAMSKDLKKRGFNFVGSTICYAFMQAVGMVNDHAIDCCCR